MNDDERTKEALFRHAILGDLLSRKLRWGQLRPLLTELSEKTFEDYRGCPRQMAYGTLEEWLYKKSSINNIYKWSQSGVQWLHGKKQCLNHEIRAYLAISG